ncbi:hypothetical protein VPH35_074335 [Triticum aestivum]
MEANEEQCELTLHSSPSSVREPPGLFLCVYCGRNFYNSQARRREMATTRRMHAASPPLSPTPSSHDAATARLSAEDYSAAWTGPTHATGLFAAAKKARMEIQLERGRSFPEYDDARTGDGLDLSLQL